MLTDQCKRMPAASSHHALRKSKYRQPACRHACLHLSAPRHACASPLLCRGSSMRSPQSSSAGASSSEEPSAARRAYPPATLPARIALFTVQPSPPAAGPPPRRANLPCTTTTNNGFADTLKVCAGPTYYSAAMKALSLTIAGDEAACSYTC